MAITVASARGMSEAEFRMHMETLHPLAADRGRASHGAQHRGDRRDGNDRGHIHLETAEIVEAPAGIVIVPDVRELAGWKFIKHIRLRHPFVRDATFDSHTIDHSNRYQKHDHEHTAGTWNTVGQHYALQEAVSYRQPILPPARLMEPGAFMAHTRTQHGTVYNGFQEHDREHCLTPDFFDHVHKSDERKAG